MPRFLSARFHRLGSTHLAVKVQITALLAAILILPSRGMPAGETAQDPSEVSPLPALITFADNLIEHGRDRYGVKHTPLFVSQLNIDTKSIPPADTHLYAPSNRGGAGPTTNNLEFDSGLIRFLDALTQVTGSHKYSAAVDEYLTYYLTNLPEPKTGFFPWGDHRGYDVVSDDVHQGFHEFKVIYPPWERCFRVNRTAVTRQIESLQLHIYDRSRSLAFSRHYPAGGEIPHSMNSSGGAWIVAWCFLYKQTGKRQYLQWAEQLRDYFWSIRDPGTSLLAAHPADPAYPETMRDTRARLRASRTEYMGQLAWLGPNLLRAAQLLDSQEGAEFRRQALVYIRAFTERMDVADEGSFWATFDLRSGKPLFPRITDGWAFVPQQDDRYRWSNSVLGIRAPIALAFACKMTGKTDLREIFDRLLPLYRVDDFAVPAAPRRELPAGLLAQAIVSFLNMYQATAEASYLVKAQVFGRYAARHYLVDGWCVCGPPLLARYQDRRVNTWRLYCNRGGSAELALALLRLHLVCQGQADPVDDNPMCYF